MTTDTFEAIGTHWNIDIEDTLSDGQRASLLKTITDRIDTFDRGYSRFRPDSLVTKMSQAAGVFTLPEDAAPMMSLYRHAYEMTNGAVTPLIGSLMVEAGYDATYSLVSKELHHPPAWDETMEYQPPQTLRMKRPALLDVGAFGKGYLVDIVGELLEQQGIKKYCVDAGGDMRHRSDGDDRLRVGLEHPLNTQQIIGVATIANRSICGSSGNRRAWGKFHHIINPHTLASPRDIVATWAAASTTLLADAMATCLYFTSPDVLSRYYSFDYLVMKSDATVLASTGFPQELFRASDQSS